MATVYPAKGVPLDIAIRRFNRLVELEGIIADYRRHEYYRSPAQKRREKSARARARSRKKHRQSSEHFRYDIYKLKFF